MTLRIGWLSTGRDQAAADLLSTVWDAIQRGEMDVEIAFVFCDREPGEFPVSDRFIDLVRGYGIPLVTLSSRRFRAEQPPNPDVSETGFAPWRRGFHEEAMCRIESFRADLLVLAGYMLIASAEMCRRFDMLNLHPAAPGGPAGTWQEVIWQLIEGRAAETGVMWHLATKDLDQGPAVTYCTFPIRGDAFDPLWREIEGMPVEKLRQEPGVELPLFKLIRRQGVAREMLLIVRTIKAFAEGRVRIQDKRVVDIEGREIAGYSLTEEIDRALAAQSRGGVMSF